MRYEINDWSEKEDFLNSRDFNWIAVSSYLSYPYVHLGNSDLQVDEEEKERYSKELKAASAGRNDKFAQERYYKVC